VSWSKVGSWIKDNAGTGASLVGSLLTGNLPAAVAAGVSLVSSATGTDNPNAALEQLQTNPETMVRLKELYYENEQAVRQHLYAMKRLELEDAQKEHETTQSTIQAGDKAEDSFVRRTRPAQSWLSLISAIGYVFVVDTVDPFVLGALLALPLSYAGLRQVGKGFDSFANIKKGK
jgi:hypothetical protein